MHADTGEGYVHRKLGILSVGDQVLGASANVRAFHRVRQMSSLDKVRYYKQWLDSGSCLRQGQIHVLERVP